MLKFIEGYMRMGLLKYYFRNGFIENFINYVHGFVEIYIVFVLFYSFREWRVCGYNLMNALTDLKVEIDEKLALGLWDLRR